MELTNEFRVGVPVERAWAVLNDVERVAPCLPGAQLQEIEGDEYRGIVKVKVGPITASYEGTATFLSRDEAAGTLVLRAQGRETRGQGNATATVTATLVADGDSTSVSVVTDLTVTGKVAQFGRGVLADVSGRLIGQFVECLESTVLAAAETAAVAATGTTATGAEVPETPPAARVISSAEPEAVDLLGAAGRPVAQRVAPVVGVLFVLWLLRRLLGSSGD